jgi:epoxyqueuosine reductase
MVAQYQDAQRRQQFVIDTFLELGFDDVGIVSAEQEFLHTEQMRNWYAQELYGPLEYMKNTREKRLNIREHYPFAQSVIIAVANYYTGDHHEHDRPERSARVSRYAWGKDYHAVLGRRLRKFCKRAREHFGDSALFVPFTDAKPVSERAYAELAGLGFIGKSTMLIHRKLGTWTFLAGCVSNIKIEATTQPPMPDFCGSCRACLDACPTQAITQPFVLDANRCISTWTVEKPFAQEGEKCIQQSEWVAGCDICQEVCPWNRFAQQSREHRFRPIPAHVYWSAQSDDTQIAGTPLARPGKEALDYNLERLNKSAS